MKCHLPLRDLFFGADLGDRTWLPVGQIDDGTDTCAKAAQHGQLAYIQWARARGCPWDELTCRRAAENGHLDVLEWAYVEGCPIEKEQIYDAARLGGDEVLNWVLELER